ncbi:MAG: hypothetical protein ABH872_05350 [Candidatus Omnitrophota bacterium]
MKRLILLFCLWSLALGLESAKAEVPHLINYQGKLTGPSGTALEGVYTITFRIYNVAKNDVPVWTEARSGTIVNKGVFSVLLGSVIPLDLDFSFNGPYWLGVQVGNDQEMSPRQGIASVIYAIRAEKAENSVSAHNSNLLGGRNPSVSSAPNTIPVTDAAGFVATPSFAPSSDYQVANKKYVDDKSAGAVSRFSAWQEKSFEATYQAETDGFVCAHGQTGGGESYIMGYSDSTSNPGTKRVVNSPGYVEKEEDGYLGITMPVRKGDYWRVESQSIALGKVYWMPIGQGEQ